MFSRPHLIKARYVIYVRGSNAKIIPYSLKNKTTFITRRPRVLDEKFEKNILNTGGVSVARADPQT